MFILNAFKWFAMLLTAITVARVIIGKCGGWDTCKKQISEKAEKCFETPVVGNVLRIVYKAICCAVRATRDTLRWIAKWPVICTVIAVIGKAWRVVVAKWAALVTWSKAE